ncbi:MAG: hemolysin III family protein [Myxococcota bacterium]
MGATRCSGKGGRYAALVTRPDLSKDHSPHVTNERFNTASHLVSAVFALMGGAWLIVQSSIAGSVWHIVAHSIYGATLVSLFIASTLHHGINGSPALERRLRTLDYLGIYLLIAGTMTPICMALLRTPTAWVIFGVAWGVGAAGIALRAARPDLPKWVSSTLYGALGALGVVLAWPVYLETGVFGTGLLAGGGAAYILGSLIFTIERPNPVPGWFGFHEIWHLFVIAGATAHFAFMAFFVLPAPPL